MQIHKKQAHQFSHIIDLVTQIRSLRSVHKIDPQTKLTLLLQNKHRDILENQQEILKRLARLKEIEFIDGNKKNPENSVAFETAFDLSYIHLGGVLDPEKEKKRLATEARELQILITRTTARLKNSSYRKKAPAHIVKESENLLRKYQTKLIHLRKYKKNISS